MAKCGDAIALIANGTRFAIPKDKEPNVIKGGLINTDTVDYGDGTADTYKSNVIPKITGLAVKVSEANKEAWDNACKAEDIPIILECVSKSYELTGSIIGEIEISTTKTLREILRFVAQMEQE